MGGDPGGRNAAYTNFMKWIEAIEARQPGLIVDFEVEVAETRELDWRNMIDEGT